MSQINYLDNEKKATDFYEKRYSTGYMDEWPVEKKWRVFDIIKNLNLPETGEALDFGCGNGVFTRIIQQALPHWRIYGCDISQVAIENARKRFPGCNFFLLGDESYKDKKFDFLFSHHTLEHVLDIVRTCDEMVLYLKDSSSMLHILPCGNKGSFEYKLCLLIKDGIDYGRGGRFYFEDEGHLRRLTTEQLNDLFKKSSFNLSKDFYSNQYYGAIDWITRASPFFVWRFINPARAKNQDSRRQLLKLNIVLITLNLWRTPVNIFAKIINKYRRTLLNYLTLVFCAIPYIISKPLDIFLKYLAKIEWKIHKTEPHGSEMYLFYTRRSGSINDCD